MDTSGAPHTSRSPRQRRYIVAGHDIRGQVGWVVSGCFKGIELGGWQGGLRMGVLRGGQGGETGTGCGGGGGG